MSLVKTVQSWPKEWATCPVYCKGYVVTNDDGSQQVSDGKRPINGSHKARFSPARTVLKIEEHPEIYKAAGVFTGALSDGLVVLDVDANLGAITMKWGDDLAKAPKIVSTKKNAAKFLFKVPKDLWHTVSDCTQACAGNQGFEILWSRMAVLTGAYPGKERLGAPEGQYTLTGDLNAIPEAPEWLIAIMQEVKERDNKRASSLTGNKQVDLYRNWSREKRLAICQACLTVIPIRGKGERHWWRIGAMLHAAGLGDDGLKLWSDWSRLDPEYASDWEKGNPCAKKWPDFKEEGGYTIRSLIGEANIHDPNQTRFKDTSLAKDVEEAESAAVTIRQVSLTFEEIIERGMKIYEGEDVARMNYELHALAMEARYKDQSGIEKLLLDHITQQNKGIGHSMAERKSSKRSYLIPGLLPSPYSILFFGEAGCGKSATAIALMKHVVDGLPFQLKDQLVPVERGPVIYFNGDMSEQDFEEEFDLHEIKHEADFHFEPDFNLYKRVQFVKTMNRIKPRMICIDSLSSCSGAKAGDENKAEFAQPLYWLNANNGTLWPACTIVVLHHSAKASGTARGSGAITAAVAEVWKIDAPAKDSGLSADQRVITIGKSRINRKGETLIQSQMDDLTVQIKEVRRKEEVQTKAGSVADKIMVRLQTSGKPMSRSDLNADVVVEGSAAAIRKSLQRLENRGVVEVTERSSGSGGKPEKYYSALRAWGESKTMGQHTQTPCNDRNEEWDTRSEGTGTSQAVPFSPGRNGTLSKKAKPAKECPIAESSAGAGSDPVGTQDLYPHAREQRSADEIAKLNDEAWNVWD